MGIETGIKDRISKAYSPTLNLAFSNANSKWADYMIGDFDEEYQISL